MDHKLAKDFKKWLKDLTNLEKEVSRSNEKFIIHLTKTYEEVLPPIWAVCEVMTFGQLSKWYENMSPIQTRKRISKTYAMNEQVLSSWLQHLTIIRNICAHHSRLWNREFAVISSYPKKNSLISQAFLTGSRKIYNGLLILLHFMDCISPQHRWREELKDLLAQNSEFLSQMGFPDRWEEQQIWQI